METMTLTINLPEDVGAVLESKAKLRGTGLAEYVETMITAQAKRPTFRELFADVRQNISLTDEELEKEIDAAIIESREAKSKR